MGVEELEKNDPKMQTDFTVVSFSWSGRRCPLRRHSPLRLHWQMSSSGKVSAFRDRTPWECPVWVRTPCPLSASPPWSCSSRSRPRAPWRSPRTGRTEASEPSRSGRERNRGHQHPHPCWHDPIQSPGGLVCRQWGSNCRVWKSRWRLSSSLRPRFGSRSWLWSGWWRLEGTVVVAHSAVCATSLREKKTINEDKRMLTYDTWHQGDAVLRLLRTSRLIEPTHTHLAALVPPTTRALGVFEEEWRTGGCPLGERWRCSELPSPEFVKKCTGWYFIIVPMFAGDTFYFCEDYCW